MISSGVMAARSPGSNPSTAKMNNLSGSTAVGNNLDPTAFPCNDIDGLDGEFLSDFL